jgi:hypothetical protein
LGPLVSFGWHLGWLVGFGLLVLDRRRVPHYVSACALFVVYFDIVSILFAYSSVCLVRPDGLGSPVDDPGQKFDLLLEALPSRHSRRRRRSGLAVWRPVPGQDAVASNGTSQA